MKSIEEKAKAYDEALEKARKLATDLPNGRNDRLYHVDDLEYIFPEIVESEDERIRKWLIALIKSNEYGSISNVGKMPCPKLNVISWLEKQCEDARIEALRTEYEKGRADAIAEFEKQIIPQVKKEPKFKVEPNDYSSIDPHFGKPIEQKPIDNVEPKFKIGDFVVDNCGYVWKIEGIINQFYILEGIDGGESRPTIEWVNKTFHLWDITKDAKDGDVLVHSSFMFDDFIFIYNNTSILQAYCYYSKERNRFIMEDRGHHCPWNMQEVTPATKEQRDLLFQKIKDAGYEWDVEKKELKKIEQNPAWSEEDERIRQCLIRDQEKALDDVRNDKYGHSEIISDLKEMYRERINWLKSIKDRYTWKPTKRQVEALMKARLDLQGKEYHTILAELHSQLIKMI